MALPRKSLLNRLLHTLLRRERERERDREMEVEKICCGCGGGGDGGGMISGSKEDDGAQLPGFRFHPTDEELVGFYLRRKVEKRAISIELIKQVDIYKYDPWDLPKEASSVGDKEWYFFCKRGRKYRNSIRPNRVTGSGFWKATGIDRPIYSAGGEGRECIGLKKSLVYYRGSAGKGTKTDWMMHEFRLPSHHDDKSTKHIDVKSMAQEAEVWTLCRIFKRNVTYRKCIPDWRELAARRNNPADTTYKTCSPDSDDHHHDNYINFGAPTRQTDKRQFPNHHAVANPTLMGQTSLGPQAPPAPYPCLFSPEMNEFIKYGDWDELRSVVEYSSFDPSSCK